MAEIKIVKSKNVDPQPLLATDGLSSGCLKRLIYPHTVDTQRSFMGAAEVEPGFSPHRWHKHERDNGKDFEIEYSQNFEEIYYIVKGSGVVQFKDADGLMNSIQVEAGDAIYFPPGVGFHQLLNNGTEKMFLVFCGGPPPKVTLKG